MIINEWIANRIKFYCNDRNITLNKLATLSGITQSTLNSVVKAESKNPRIDTIIKICYALEITPSIFFNNIENEIDIEE